MRLLEMEGGVSPHRFCCGGWSSPLHLAALSPSISLVHRGNRRLRGKPLLLAPDALTLFALGTDDARTQTSPNMLDGTEHHGKNGMTSLQ